MQGITGKGVVVSVFDDGMYACMLPIMHELCHFYILH